MIAPFPLYVDEISSDNIKATVTTISTVAYNMRMLLLDMPFPARDPFQDPSYRGSVADRLGEEMNGIFITPVGKFICMLVRDSGYRSMIFLDLIDKADLAAAMAEKLNHVDLRERFMQVYEEIISHPEKHRRFKLVVGNENV